MNYWYKLIQLTRRSRVQTRLIVSFLLLSMLPLGITGIISSNKSSQAISSKTSTYSAGILRLLQNKINEQVRNYGIFADQLMLNKEIQDGLVNYDQKSEFERSRLQLYIEQNVLRDNFWIFSTIKGLQIQLDDGRMLYEYGYSTFKENYIQLLLDKARTNKQVDFWAYAETTGGDPCLTLIRRIPSLDGAKGTLGYLIIGIDEKLFSQLTFNDVSLGDGSEFVLMNGAGEVLSSKNGLIQTGLTKEPSDPLRAWMSPRQPNGQIDLNSGHYFASYTHDEELDWYLMGLIPYTYLDAESKEIKWTIVIVSVICLLVALGFTALISTSIYSPLRKLYAATNQVKDGNLTVYIHDDGQDEIGYLSGKFNGMIQELGLLIERVKVEQGKKREAELKMLQAQINPHFLFNTLNSLKWAALLSQANSVSDGLGALAELLRNTIVHTDEQVKLRDELRNITNYMVIQQVRYGTSLQANYLITEELLEAQVLKFLLQPIVENAIIHGLEGLEREPEITISAERSGSDLKITVSDNGKGIPDEKLKQLMDASANPSTKRLANIGMGNVNERIKLHYGDKYGIAIESKPDVGTHIIITIPYLTSIGE